MLEAQIGWTEVRETLLNHVNVWPIIARSFWYSSNVLVFGTLVVLSTAGVDGVERPTILKKWNADDLKRQVFSMTLYSSGSNKTIKSITKPLWHVRMRSFKLIRSISFVEFLHLLENKKWIIDKKRIGRAFSVTTDWILLLTPQHLIVRWRTWGLSASVVTTTAQVLTYFDLRGFVWKSNIFWSLHSAIHKINLIHGF